MTGRRPLPGPKGGATGGGATAGGPPIWAGACVASIPTAPAIISAHAQIRFGMNDLALTTCH
jgi:hypothetical protein